MNQQLPLQISPEVRAALAADLGVVALESTVISHGLPSPGNLEITNAMMQVIREEGCVPALIALIDGHISVGVSQTTIERLADPASKVLKVSRRDIAYCLATKALGATTVSATMLAAHHAGIRIFATGGIGGVHRDIYERMDISADLSELAKTPVAVVCAGAKSILDIPKTLEVLESYGVPILGYRTDYFPEFYCIGDEHKMHMRCEDAQSIAEVLRLHLGLAQGGALVANPIEEGFALRKNFIEALIVQAQKKAKLAMMQGGDLTPFLLREIANKSEGSSVKSNRALLINNARLAGKISRCMAKYRRCSG